MAPPASWFRNPGFDRLTPVTVTGKGRISGHLAGWDSVHYRADGRPVRPPRSRSRYRAFRTGSVECADRSQVATGVIVADTHHAPLTAGAAGVRSFYDHSGHGAADVAAGEDEHGVWIAGAVRPDVTPAQLRRLRGSSLSGDWHPVDGQLELIAVAAVNTPGFAVPRIASDLDQYAVPAAADETPTAQEVTEARRHVQDALYEVDKARDDLASAGNADGAYRSNLRARLRAAETRAEQVRREYAWALAYDPDSDLR